MHPATVKCQDVSLLMREAEGLVALSKENEAYRKYQEALKVQPQNLMALCKASELCSTIGNRQPERASMIRYYNSGKQYAASALRINPDYSDANFAMSLAMGRLALILNGGEKIQAVKDIRRYAELAVKSDPTNFKAFHVLGKWHYEVSSLSSFERTAVRIFFGGLQPSSFDEAIRCYEKSRLLKPDFSLNYLEMAKACHKNKQQAKAIDLLRKLQLMPVSSADDPRIKKEAAELMKEWN